MLKGCTGVKRILLLLPNGFIPYEASAFTDVLGWNKLEGDGSTEVVGCGLRQEIKNLWGTLVIPEINISDVKSSTFDALAIPGGFEQYGYYEDVYSEKCLSLIREFDEAGKIIAAICVGALPLGKSGILRGRKGTTFCLKNGYRQKQLADYGVELIKEPMVVDGNLITSWSPSTSMDVAFKLLEMLTTAENCNKVKQAMGF
jgi:4-methyl-5(b-hydroxyethyl)-thiazole monophosphate biosynthesis